MMYGIVVTVSTILFFSVATMSYADSDSYYGYKDKDETYVNYDGKTVTEKQYIKRLGYCIDMKMDHLIPMNTDCPTWVLSYEGNSETIKYIVENELR